MEGRAEGGDEEGLMKEKGRSAAVLTRGVKGVLKKGERENAPIMD